MSNMYTKIKNGLGVWHEGTDLAWTFVIVFWQRWPEKYIFAIKNTILHTETHTHTAIILTLGGRVASSWMRPWSASWLHHQVWWRHKSCLSRCHRCRRAGRCEAALAPAGPGWRQKKNHMSKLRSVLVNDNLAKHTRKIQVCLGNITHQQSVTVYNHTPFRPNKCFFYFAIHFGHIYFLLKETR